MAATRHRVVRFDNWTGGEFGDLGASNAPQNSFTAKNMLVYNNGTIGPRPGLKNLGITSVATGAVWGFRGIGTGAGQILFGVGANLYKFTFGVAAAASSVGAATAPAAYAQLIQAGSYALWVIPSGDPWFATPPSTVTDVTDVDAPGGTTLCHYGSRYFIGGNSSAPNRVYYSDADDYQNWTATGYFDIGDATNRYTVTYLDEIRNRLVISQESGEWWAMTGTVEVDNTLRRTPREDTVPSNWWSATRLGETIYFIPYSQDYPVVFTGAVADKLQFQHLSFANGGAIGAASIPSVDVVAFVEEQSTNGRMLLFNNNAWTYHTISNSVKTSRLISTVGYGVDPSSNPLILCDGGAGGSAAKFYAFHPILDRPGKAGDTYAQPGDDSTTPLDCYLYTPEWWAPQGEEFMARTVTVEFDKWNTGSSTTNHFDVAIRNLHRYNLTSTKDSTTIAAFDEAASSTSTDATPDSRTVRFGDQGEGHGFQILLTNIRGVAIKRIIVGVEVDPARN